MEARLSLPSKAGVLLLERGSETSAGDGARTFGGFGGGGGSGIPAACCSAAVRTLVGMVIVGRRGRFFGFSSAELFSAEASREDSDVDGRVSATAITTAPESSGAFIISNSGTPIGGFVVYLVLVFRPGTCFFSEFLGRKCDFRSVVITARMGGS